MNKTDNCTKFDSGYQNRPCRDWNDDQQVIQGSHMVSSTRCPAGSDPVKRWSESRAAAPEGQCPVEHKGDFKTSIRPSILPSVLRGSRWLIKVTEGIFEGRKAILRLGGLI